MKLAINKNIINKASTDDLKRHNSTFENIDISINELAACIDQGFAFCAQLKKKDVPVKTLIVQASSQ